MQRWPETKRLLGLLVNSSGRAHARNARRLVHAARKQDRRLAAALLAAALAHTPRPRRSCAAPARGWPASPRRSRASCCATSPRAGERRPPAQARRRRAPAAPTAAAQRRRPGRAAPQNAQARPRRVGASVRSCADGTPRRPAVEDEEASERCSGDALEVDLAGAEGDAPPPSRSTSRRPRSSIRRRARRAPRLPGDSPPAQRVARAPGREHASSSAAATQRARARSRRRASIGSSSTADSRARRRLGAARRGAPGCDRDVEADPDHRPALLRAAPRPGSPRACGPSSQTSLGHLIRHSSGQRLDRLAARDGDRQRQQPWRRERRSTTEHEQRLARPARSSAGPGARGPRSARRR